MLLVRDTKSKYSPTAEHVDFQRCQKLSQRQNNAVETKHFKHHPCWYNLKLSRLHFFYLY